MKSKAHLYYEFTHYTKTIADLFLLNENNHQRIVKKI